MYTLKFQTARLFYWFSHRSRAAGDWLLLSCMSPAVRAVMKQLVEAARAPASPEPVESTPFDKPRGELN